MKQKVLLAINARSFENVLEKELKNQFEFVASAVYREAILDKIQQENPEIILINEALPGTRAWLDIVLTIRNTHKNVRIIFMTGRRQPGDLILAQLVSYGVYDIIIGDGIKKSEIIRMLKAPQAFDDVSHLLPKQKFDESNTEPSFDTHTKIIEREVVRYIPTPLNTEPEPIAESPKQAPAIDVPLFKKEEEKKTIAPTPVEVISAPTVQLKQPKKIKAPIVKTPVFPKKEKNLDIDPRKPEIEHEVLPEVKQEPPVFYPPVAQGIVQSRKIISFVGAVNGVGNTQLAFNTAVKLGMDGHRVLFLELNPVFSTIDVAFQLGEYHLGVDKALEAIASDNTKRIKDSIIKMTDVQKRSRNSEPMNKNYKKMPQSLDFMMYSQDYQTLVVKNEVEKTFLKDLCMYLLLQENYDYVVVDNEPLGQDNNSIEDIASISSKVFITMTQDTAQIGHISRHVIDMNKRISLEDKMYYIVNKYEACELSSDMVSDWLETPIDLVMPQVNKEFINSMFLGIPFVLNSRNKPTQQVFEKIKQMVVES